MDFADPRTKLTLRNLHVKDVKTGPLTVTVKGCGREAGSIHYSSMKKKLSRSVELPLKISMSVLQRST